MSDDPRKLTILRCARCGKDHIDLEFRLFKGEPIIDEDGTIWRWWAVCPETGDPVLMRDIYSNKGGNR